MRLDRIHLRDFRGVLESEVVFASRGVTIIEGDNEVGKSSLPEALDLLLTVRDDSKKAAVKAVQPVDHDAGPSVTADITSGPYRFTYSKRWLRRPETTLTVHQPSREQLTGREAHERVEAILAETVDDALWKAMRLEQGAGVDQASFDVPSLGRALDLAAGADRASSTDVALWDRIVAERDRYWTPTGKPSADRTRLRQQVDDAASALRAIESELRELDAQTDEMARLVSEARDLAAQQTELDATARELAERAEAVAVLRREVDQLSAQYDAATAAHERWMGAGQARAELLDAVEQRSASLAEAERLAEGAEPARLAAERAHADALVARDAAADALASADARHRLALADRDHRRHEIELAQLTERRDRIVTHEAALGQAEAVIEATRVDDDAVAQIEAAHLEVARAEAAAAAGAALVTATAATTTTIEVDGEAVEVEAGDPVELSVGSVAELAVPGLITFTVRAGVEAQALHSRLAEARATLARLCEQHDVTGLAEARTAAQARTEAERVRRDATERIHDDLRDLTLEALDRKISRHRDRIATYESDRPAEPPLPADLDEAQVAAERAGSALDECRREHAEAERRLADAAGARSEVAVSNAGTLERVNLDRLALDQAVDALEAARRDQSDDSLTTVVEVATAARAQAEDRLATGRSMLAGEDPETLDALVGNARQASRRGTEAIRENHDRRQRLGSVLEDRGEQGLAERRNRAATDLEHLRTELERLEARAAAARLLHDTFAARRSEARNRYVAPFRERIEQLGRLVFGPSFEVSLDADLRIATRTLDGVTVSFDQLSTGAREQLGLLSRLACAAIVANDDGGAPVVFDDALGWTDPGRLSQMAAAIGLAGRGCQVIVLTCTPGRFAGIGHAKVVRLARTSASTAPPKSDEAVEPAAEPLAG